MTSFTWARWSVGFPATGLSHGAYALYILLHPQLGGKLNPSYVFQINCFPCPLSHHDFTVVLWYMGDLPCCLFAIWCEAHVVSFSRRLLVWLEDLDVIYHGKGKWSNTEVLGGWDVFVKLFFFLNVWLHCLVFNKTIKNYNSTCLFRKAFVYELGAESPKRSYCTIPSL